MSKTPIPYAEVEDPALAELVDAIRARRGGALLNLDRMLLHSPPLARGWNALFGALRGELALAPMARELAMCFVAELNGAPYEFAQHAPLFRAAGGREATLEAMRHGAAATEQPGLSGEERALLALCYESTREVRVRPATVAAARRALGGGERVLVEYLAVIAAYNLVSRFLVATGVGPEEGDEGG
jgi:alkylhydroperoxidase family enzyme